MPHSLISHSWFSLIGPRTSSLKQVPGLRVQLCYLSYLQIRLTSPSDALRLEAVEVRSCLLAIRRGYVFYVFYAWLLVAPTEDQTLGSKKRLIVMLLQRIKLWAAKRGYLLCSYRGLNSGQQKEATCCAPTQD
jgi:hypothetical protein